MRVERPEIGYKRSIGRFWEDELEKEVAKWWDDLEMHQRFVMTM